MLTLAEFGTVWSKQTPTAGLKFQPFRPRFTT